MADLHERVCFLSQAAEYLSTVGQTGVRVGSYFQYTGREIRLKSQVSCLGWDSQKRNTCKSCFAFLNHPSSASLKVRKGFFEIHCRSCNSSRKRFPVRTERKTYYEKQLFKKIDEQRQESMEQQQQQPDASGECRVDTEVPQSCC